MYNGGAMRESFRQVLTRMLAVVQEEVTAFRKR
jgi:hypothetical protein